VISRVFDLSQLFEVLLVIDGVALASLAVKPCSVATEVDCQALLFCFWDFDTDQEPERSERLVARRAELSFELSLDDKCLRGCSSSCL
jgi:hypothetical protein